jgi:hypothetical protein
MLMSTLPTCILKQTAPNPKELGSITPPSSSSLRPRSRQITFESTVVAMLWSRAERLLLNSNFVGFPDLRCGPVGREFGVQILIVLAWFIACL